MNEKDMVMGEVKRKMAYLDELDTVPVEAVNELVATMERDGRIPIWRITQWN